MRKLFIWLIPAMIVANPIFAQQTLTIPDPLKKIEVTGSAEMEVVPDEINIGITLQEYYNKTREKVSIDAISRDFLIICEKAGIGKDRIEIQNMSGFDNTNWWNKKRKKEQPDLLQSTSYVIKFNTPAEVDKLVNMIDDNATQNIYMSTISSSKEKEYRKQLKVQALQNAKTKATYLLEGIGAKTGAVLFVREVDANAPVYPMYDRAPMANTMMAEPSANEGLNFHKIKYHYDVEAHFAIE